MFYSFQIYHRQIFKLLLSNRVLEDPRQRRLFQTSDLTELFNLNEPLDGSATESDRIFRDCKLEPKSLSSNKPSFSPHKIEAMKKLASSVSKRIQEIATKKIGDGVQEPPSETLPPGQSEPVAKNRKKRHKKKKNDEAKISALFEGEEVPCLIGRRLGRSETNEEEISSTCDDQYVLRKLFSKTSESHVKLPIPSSSIF